MDIKLNHQSRFNLQKSGVFADINSLDDLDDSIYKYGLESDDYNKVTGAAYEVYNEFFCKRNINNPLLGIKNIVDTSSDPFNSGFDFTFTDLSDKNGLLQTKWRHKSNHKFTETELATFAGRILDEGITRQNAILFTNAIHNPSVDNGSIFHYSWNERAVKRHRVFDRTMQEQFILRDQNFWNDFQNTLNKSCKTERKLISKIPELWDHQKDVNDATQPIIINGGRGRVVVATGGGKTLNQYINVEQVLFEHNGHLTIVVAPTIDLVNQHFNTYYDYGLFYRGVKVVCFKTGNKPMHDDNIKFIQTTNGDDIRPWLNTHSTNKTQVYVTYKSFCRLIKTLNDVGISADLIIFDEFQHIVSQKTNDFGISNTKEMLNNLPAKRVLFYSASQKRGRVLSAFDKNVFGNILVEVPYKRLRETAFVVPKLKIIPVRISQSIHISGLDASFRRQAEMYNNINMAEVYREAAGMIVAYKDASQHYSAGVNMITWSKKVAHLQMIMENEIVQNRLGNDVDLHAVHAQVPAASRRKIYDILQESKGNILGQHSCVSEGIDVPNLNVGYVARRLGMISTQQGPGGRPTRTHPDDKQQFMNGKLNIDNPAGWKKYSASVYVLVENEEDETFLEYMKDLIRKLQFAGLTEDDYEFIDIQDQRTGDTDPDTSWMAEIGNLLNIESESLEDTIKKAQLEQEEEEKTNELNSELTDYMNKPFNVKLDEINDLF